jgi:serine O-acetyltransferase
VGANAVVTKDVMPGAVMVGIPARAIMVDGGKGGSAFIPYGTPCSEQFDPQTQKVELLRCEIETLRKRLDALLAEHEDLRDRA